MVIEEADVVEAKSAQNKNDGHGKAHHHKKFQNKRK